MNIGEEVGEIQCHGHKNNQDKNIFKKHKPTMMKVSLTFYVQIMENENQGQEHKVCKM
jgi:hypothetical protein